MINNDPEKTFCAHCKDFVSISEIEENGPEGEFHRTYTHKKCGGKTYWKQIKVTGDCKVDWTSPEEKEDTIMQCNWDKSIKCGDAMFCYLGNPERCRKYQLAMEGGKTMSGPFISVKVDNVLRAAEKCGTAKSVLKELFPELFPASLHLPSGTLFYQVEGPMEKQAIENGEKPIKNINSLNIDKFFILAHAGENMTYQVVGLKSGFSLGWKVSKFGYQFKRKRSERTIEIPVEFLNQHYLIVLKDFR